MPQGALSVGTGWSELIALLLGGFITHMMGPMIQNILKKPTEDFKQAAAIRDELRQQIEDFGERLAHQETLISDLQKEVDEWRDKYYTVLEANLKLQQEIAVMMQEIRALRVQQGENL